MLLVLVLVLLPPAESLLEQETRSMAPSKRKPKLHCPATMLGSTLAVHRPMHTAADYHSKSEPARLVVTLTAWVVMLLELLMLVLLPVLLLLFVLPDLVGNCEGLRVVLLATSICHMSDGFGEALHWTGNHIPLPSEGCSAE